MSRYNSRFQRIVKKVLPNTLKEKYQQTINRNQISIWEKAGKPLPPPHIVKVKTVNKYRTLTGFTTFVESGTFMGDMIASQLNNFDSIYSIELSEKYWNDAKVKFKNESHVVLLHGDSGKVLKSLIQQIKESSVFWLDGHYSGGDTAKGEKMCPIFEELKGIFNSDLSHCLLIDDARLFNGTEDYPTLEDLKGFVLKNKPNAKFSIESDTIIVLY